MRRILLFGGWTFVLLAQQKLDPRHMHERCYAVLPMIGTGTMADPRRPLYAPLTSVISAVPLAG
ncbi:MAG: hypothetical protein ACR2NN_12925, partial [Bryobacteraceae bacterium]